ncbi:MAG: aldo/keto reductase [Burkholderiaceae bacterium]|nr:aldo/keto reductase [Burkholderiaceae bacterium]
MHTRRIGSLEVSAIGLGCMSLSHAYAPRPSPDTAAALLRAALDAGVTLFDTAMLYGAGANEALVGRTLGAHRPRCVLASKGGMGVVDGRRAIDGRPQTIRQNCDESLARLGTDVIDLYYLHRLDAQVPVEESVGAMAGLVRAGKVREIGLSEVSAATLRRAHAVHPIAAVQNEYSLWTRNVEIAVLDACRELGISLVAFSPLARGFLTGTLRDPSTLPPSDIRRGMPRFEPPHWEANLRLLEPYRLLANEAHCTMAQLALAWLLARDEAVVPIPGTTSVAHLHENLGAVDIALSADLVARIGASINQRNVSGPRYAPERQADIDTEDFE